MFTFNWLKKNNVASNGLTNLHCLHFSDSSQQKKNKLKLIAVIPILPSNSLLK